MNDPEAHRVPFRNLAREIDELRPRLDAAIARVLDRSRFVLGEELDLFEHELATVCGTDHAIGVGSGTDAIEIGLRAIGVRPGDEVVTQANTCVPTVAAIVRAGAEPVLCDADPDTALLDPDSLAAVISPRTRAVVPVHLYGQCGDMDSICTIADDHGISVVEDCAQALGARSRSAAAGNHGVLGALSFYPTKNLGAFGDGGAIVTSDPDVAQQARRLRRYGTDGRGRAVEPGGNSRLDELQAAVLLTKLPRLIEASARRARIASRYDGAFRDSDVHPLMRVPGHAHSFHLYVVRSTNRDSFRRELARRGVETRVHYETPLHLEPAYRAARRTPSLEEAERLAREVVSIPLYPELTEGEVEYVIDSVRGATSP